MRAKKGPGTGHPVNPITFGQRLRRLRKGRGVSQRTLADACGISFTYVSRIENSRLDFNDVPAAKTIVAMARALEADPDELLSWAGKVPEDVLRRVAERPAQFRALCRLGDRQLDRLVALIPSLSGRRPPPTAPLLGVGEAGEDS